ncbi:efflux RND transporter periplasmic adaptor subunit [Alteromonas sp. BL110]|uniref:efflux RND transporter periplasmic adaptor subunit n=1 Tax=Alteromonas sp. BL110 TaxID=1714845 RepID=UPI000E4AC75C|nr:efflux RND transporter periplasmic adaptor subunit [Alteromonas sp. BL110]AXT39841.1 efflux RND transporter periplasmic adaptor subunit [Alteromonas sp. BL110]RKM79070.1 efflux RND transporter periplasmic adaptor subunit [Alteromonas sp. BL110]
MKIKREQFVAVLLAVAFVTGCEQQPSEPQGEFPGARLAEVSYINVAASRHNIDSHSQGRVTASKEAEVRPQVSGIIQQRLFTEGEIVEKGQTLYQIDPETYQAAYNETFASLSNAKAAEATAKLKDERYANLLEIEGISQQDADDAHAEYLEAKANVDMYEAALETAKINLQYTKVLAPISGRIGISSVTQGALVTAQQDSALATIRTLDPIYVDIVKSSKALLRLRKIISKENIQEGTAEVTLTLEDGSDYELTGELKMQEVAVDASTGSVTLRAEFPNPDGVLLPGMFVRAIVSDAVDENAILVPQQSIYHSATDEAYAYVINQDNQVEKRSVKTAVAIGNQWVIIDGLKVNDKLLVEGAGKVGPGSEVIPVEVKVDSNGSIIYDSNNLSDQVTTGSH